jgi:hypothetical protein
MAFPNFDAIVKKLTQDEDTSLSERLSALVEIMPTIKMLQDLLECEIDGNFIHRYFPETSGYFDSFELKLEAKGGPQIVAKFEKNTSCGCHPDYEHTHYSIPVDVILEGAEGVKKFRAIEDAKVMAVNEAKRLAEEEEERKAGAAREQREREELARLSQKYKT